MMHLRGLRPAKSQRDAAEWISASAVCLEAFLTDGIGPAFLRAVASDLLGALKEQAAAERAEGAA